MGYMCVWSVGLSTHVLPDLSVHGTLTTPVARHFKCVYLLLPILHYSPRVTAYYNDDLAEVQLSNSETFCRNQ